MNTIREFHKNAVDFQKAGKKGEGIESIIEGNFIISSGSGLISGSIAEMMFDRNNFNQSELVYGMARTLIGLEILASALGTSIMEIMQTHNEAVMKSDNASKEHSS